MDFLLAHSTAISTSPPRMEKALSMSLLVPDANSIRPAISCALGFDTAHWDDEQQWVVTGAILFDGWVGGHLRSIQILCWHWPQHHKTKKEDMRFINTAFIAYLFLDFFLGPTFHICFPRKENLFRLGNTTSVLIQPDTFFEYLPYANDCADSHSMYGIVFYFFQTLFMSLYKTVSKLCSLVYSILLF